MKALVTGALGQLGYDLMKELEKRGHEAIASDIAPKSEYESYAQMDITDRDAVLKTISEIKPDVIIHAAAWTDVDGAEDGRNRDKVFRINAYGTENIALAAKEAQAKMVYISTDYVFSGDGETPWDSDLTDFAPLNAYGESKLKGEEAVRENLDKYFIVRISWVFGKNGKNFVKTMLRLSETHDELRVVSDQIGSPTYTRDLSKLLVDMAESDKYGVYHATNSGKFISWCDFAKAIFKEAGKGTKVIPVTTEEYGESKAKRPKNSRMDKSKLKRNGFNELPTWNDALRRFLKEIES